MGKLSRNKKCEQCKKSFRVELYREKKARFCSNRCRGTAILNRPDVRQKNKQSLKGFQPKNQLSWKGAGHPRWKGGRLVTRGYVYVWTPKGHKREHRLLMELKIGRALRPDEHVHHLNHIKIDNRIENLALMGIKEHGSLHGKEGKGITKKYGRKILKK